MLALKRSRLRLVLIRGVMMLLSLTVALALAEVLLRMLWPQQTGPVQFVYDPIRGAIPVPNQRARRILPGVYDYTYSNNSLGLRGAREYAERQAEKNRILTLGDSFTYGIGVNDDQTFASLLEQIMSDCEVINGGNGGTGTDYALKFFQSIGRSLHPDTVALCFFSNDFQDNEQGKYYEVKDSSLTSRDLSKSVTARKAFLNIPSYNWLITHSHLANLIKQSFVRYSLRAEKTTGHNSEATNEYSNDSNKRLTERYIVELWRAVRESQASFFVFYIPSANEVLGYRANETKSQDEAALEQITRQHQIKLISLTEALARSGYSIQTLYYVEGHWKPLAHQLVATVMAGVFRNKTARATKSYSSKYEIQSQASNVHPRNKCLSR
jgi:hypothetical protein